MLNSKQYYYEFGLSMFLYTISIFVSVTFVVTHPESPWRLWVSLLPVLPSVLAVSAVIRELRKLDELQQRIQMMSFAISFAIVGIATFTYGFLENVGFPPIPMLWIFPFMIATWGVTTAIVARRFN